MNNEQAINGVNNNKSKSKKGIIIALSILVFIIVLTISLIFILGGKKQTDKELDLYFDSKKLIKIKKDGNYGFIDTNGKIVIEPKYDEVSEFYGDYAIAYGETLIDGENKKRYLLIDKKGNIKQNASYSSDMKYFPESGIWLINEVLYDESLKQISDSNLKITGGEYGYFSWEDEEKNATGVMNKKGKIVYTYQYKEGELYFSLDVSENHEDLKQTYCRINVENEKYAIINCDTGKVVYDFTDNKLFDEDDNIFTMYDKAIDNRLSIMYIQDDKVIYESKDKSIDLDYDYGYIEIEDDSKDYNDKYSYIDISTGKIVKSKNNSSDKDYSSLDAWELYTGYKKNSCSGSYGIKINDRDVLPCEWDSIEFLDVDLYKYLKSKGKDFVFGEKNNKTYLINLKNGKTVAEFNTRSIYSDDDSTFISYTDKDTNKKVAYNLISGKSQEFDESAYINKYSNYIKVEVNNKKNYYNTDLKLIYTE